MPQHYKALLQKKDAALATSTDCFAPVSSAPAHLYTAKGIMIGKRLSQSNPATSVRDSSLQSTDKPLQSQLEEQRALSVQLRGRVKYLEALLEAHKIPFQTN